MPRKKTKKPEVQVVERDPLEPSDEAKRIAEEGAAEAAKYAVPAPVELDPPA